MKPAAASSGRPVLQPRAAKSAAFTTRSSSESRYRPNAVIRPVSRASWPSALSSTVFSWSSSAAARNRPCPSWTAATTPVTPAVAATSGGPTRRGTSATTRTCASGRNTSSQATSQPTLAFRDLFRAPLGTHGLADGNPGADQLATTLDLIPDVPEQVSARAAGLVHVGDDALPILLLPALDRVEPGIDLADGLVAEVEH